MHRHLKLHGCNGPSELGSLDAVSVMGEVFVDSIISGSRGVETDKSEVTLTLVNNDCARVIYNQQNRVRRPATAPANLKSENWRRNQTPRTGILSNRRATT